MRYIPASTRLRRSANHPSQRGLTLVELMVAMVISLFMLIAIALVYSSSKTGFVYANNTVRMSEDASFAVDSLSRDIRMAGFGGCAGTVQPRTAGPDAVLYTADDVFDDPTINSPIATTSTPKLFNVTNLTGTFDAPSPFSALALTSRNAVVGFPGGTSVEAVAARTALHPTASTQYAVSTTAPMLYVAGGAAKAYQVMAVTKGQVNATLTGTPYDGPRFYENTFMLVSDCKGAEIFRMGSRMNSTSGDFTNEKNFLNDYGADAIVTPLQTSTYFLAKRNGATNSSLYRRYFTSTASAAGSAATFEELVPNVEALTFHYGENTSCLNNANAVVLCTAPGAVKPSFVADVYRTSASAVTDWSRVVSVRIGLIMVSEDSRLAPETDGTVKWIGDGIDNGDYTPPAPNNDKRLRRAYSTTVSIRNRMGI